MAPVLHGVLKEPMWLNLPEIASMAREQVALERRAGALTHDARVTLVRRYLYFRFRFALSFEQVRALESARIAADPSFAGPKPDWVA